MEVEVEVGVGVGVEVEVEVEVGVGVGAEVEVEQSRAESRRVRQGRVEQRSCDSDCVLQVFVGRLHWNCYIKDAI